MVAVVATAVVQGRWTDRWSSEPAKQILQFEEAYEAWLTAKIRHCESPDDTHMIAVLDAAAAKVIASIQHYWPNEQA